MTSVVRNAVRVVKGMMLRLPMMITCRQFEDFILDYLDGNLRATQRRVFEMHLRICRECRQYLAAYQRTMELSRVALQDSPSVEMGDVPEDLIKAVIEARKAK